MNAVIAANTVTMMVATADSDPTFEAFRKNSEYFYFSYFCIEFAMKNFAFGMKRVLVDPLNRLDGFVVAPASSTCLSTRSRQQEA